MQKDMKMQVRLKVQRAHTAIVASIPYWEDRLQAAQNEHEDYIVERAKRIQLEKTWCGGYKYNAEEARRIAREGYSKYSLGAEEFSKTYGQVKVMRNILARMNHLADCTRNKSGFMIWFEEKDYIKFMPELND